MRDVGSLVGYTVAVTAVRRRLEFGTALERRGARIVYAPTMQIVAPVQDAELQDATKLCIAAPLDIIVATTAMGFRAWFEAAEEWGLGPLLRTRLREAAVVARSPKVLSALRAAGVVEAWTPSSESDSELLAYLLEQDLTGLRVGVQSHGEPLPDLVSTLVAAGAEVMSVDVYRGAPPADDVAVGQLVRALSAPEHSAIDALAFTSAPAVSGLLRAAAVADLHDPVVQALRSRVIVACIGPVTAAPLLRLDVPVVQPTRYKLGSLVREIAEQLPARRGLMLTVAGHRLDVRGHVAVMDGVAIPLPWSAMGVLRELARYPGRVATRTELLDVLDCDEPGLDAAVAALRTSLGDSRTVQSVAERGFRLAYETDNAVVCGHENP